MVSCTFTSHRNEEVGRRKCESVEVATLQRAEKEDIHSRRTTDVLMVGHIQSRMGHVRGFTP